MRIKGQVILSEIDESYFAVPVGKSAEQFHGMVKLNQTGADIWRGLEKGWNPEQIAGQLVNDYNGVDNMSALRAVQKVIDQLKEADLLEE